MSPVKIGMMKQQTKTQVTKKRKNRMHANNVTLISLYK
jgi:hypothetical protein